jgi:L-rhamnose isomerase/sugar isomerase
MLGEQLHRRDVDIEAVIARVTAFKVETPSWGYANSGTRFKVFASPGAARDIHEKVADAALVNRLTGACPTFAIHIPWDSVDDWNRLAASASEQGLRIGAVNPNLFEAEPYRLGSLAHPDAGVRRMAIEHMLECIEIAKQVGSKILSLWLADGTNFAGQDDLRSRKRRLFAALGEVYAKVPLDTRLLIEYKFFEPAFYHTDLADWGMAYRLATELGSQAQVLVDTGHHAQGTNIEQIVATLLDEQRLGGFHFNARRYADDDLIVASVNPFELFCIFHELRCAEDDPELSAAAGRVSYVIDQSHNIEPKVEAMVQSVINIQTAHAKALLVDIGRLREAQVEGLVLDAHRVLVDAYQTDVRPILAEARRRIGIDPDPIEALRRSGYQEKVATERGTA